MKRTQFQGLWVSAYLCAKRQWHCFSVCFSKRKRRDKKALVFFYFLCASEVEVDVFWIFKELFWDRYFTFFHVSKHFHHFAFSFDDTKHVNRFIFMKHFYAFVEWQKNLDWWWIQVKMEKMTHDSKSSQSRFTLVQHQLKQQNLERGGVVWCPARGQFLKRLGSARKLKMTCQGWICQCSQVKICMAPGPFTSFHSQVQWLRRVPLASQCLRNWPWQVCLFLGYIPQDKISPPSGLLLFAPLTEPWVAFHAQI